MKRSLSLMGCGLLVVALASFGSGCSSKKKSTTTPDSGTGGTGGGSGGGGGSSGKGGSGGGGGAGAGGAKADAGSITKAQCMMMVDTNSGGKTSSTCSDCLCAADPKNTAACDGMCWALAACVGANCSPTDMPCITMKCTAYLAGATKATATPFAMCPTQCTVPKAGDGGVDAGN